MTLLTRSFEMGQDGRMDSKSMLAKMSSLILQSNSLNNLKNQRSHSSLWSSHVHHLSFPHRANFHPSYLCCLHLTWVSHWRLSNLLHSNPKDSFLAILFPRCFCHSSNIFTAHFVLYRVLFGSVSSGHELSSSTDLGFRKRHD